MKEKFNERMVTLLENMSDSRQNLEFEYKLVGAIHRLDYNEFYTSQLLERARERSRTRSTSTSTVQSTTSTTYSRGSHLNTSTTGQPRSDHGPSYRAK